MASIRLLGRTSSINVRKVLWTLAELGVPFEHEDEWGTRSRGLTSHEFKALNPNAMVPVLQDADIVLWESNAICRYLAFKYERTDLLPLSPPERANVEMWMDWQATELNTAWRYAFMHHIRKNPAYDDGVQVAKSITRANALMALLDEHLETTGPYITGPQFTLADIVIGLSTHRWKSMPIERLDVARVDAWLQTLMERKSAQVFMSSQYP